MGMLTKQDLSEIGKLIGDSQVVLQTALEKKIEESSEKIIGAVGEMIEQNVMPQFDGVYDRLDKIEVRLNTEMVTKSYLDEKLGVLSGGMTVKHKDFDRRLTALESPS